MHSLVSAKDPNSFGTVDRLVLAAANTYLQGSELALFQQMVDSLNNARNEAAESLFSSSSVSFNKANFQVGVASYVYLRIMPTGNHGGLTLVFSGAKLLQQRERQGDLEDRRVHVQRRAEYHQGALLHFRLTAGRVLLRYVPRRSYIPAVRARLTLICCREPDDGPGREDLRSTERGDHSAAGEQCKGTRQRDRSFLKI